MLERSLLTLISFDEEEIEMKNLVEEKVIEMVKVNLPVVVMSVPLMLRQVMGPRQLMKFAMS